MTLKEIKNAVDEGCTVCWKNEAYLVKKWSDGYNIVNQYNDHAIGLTWTDDTTMNGKEEDFYILKNKGEQND